ncbi:MAG: hypothetical protein ACTSVK_08515 [Promethearchaeota archaeon]
MKKLRSFSIKNNKWATIFRNTNKSKLIGQQFSRLRMGQTYYSMIISTISAISLITMAFNLNFWILIIIFPIILVGTFVIGYFLDKKNINLEDYRKQVEMQSRKLNVQDIKTQEFNLLQTLFIIKALKENIDEKTLFEEYEKYKARWS